jgi:DNA-binding response OmpR family regulator
VNSVLVVEDDPELRENLREILVGDGFDVVTAKSGSDALEFIAQKSFDIAILDLVMPGLNGLETLLLLRRERPQLRAVVITAFSTVENAVEAMRKGADDYLTKPFRTADLLATLKRVIEEDKFQACVAALDVDSTFSALANPLRRDILQLIETRGRLRFMELTRELGIDDHTKVNFHLRVLKEYGLVGQDDKRMYCLSAKGSKVVRCLKAIIQNLSG